MLWGLKASRRKGHLSIVERISKLYSANPILTSAEGCCASPLTQALPDLGSVSPNPKHEELRWTSNSSQRFECFFLNVPYEPDDHVWLCQEVCRVWLFQIRPMNTEHPLGSLLQPRKNRISDMQLGPGHTFLWKESFKLSKAAESEILRKMHFHAWLLSLENL